MASPTKPDWQAIGKKSAKDGELTEKDVAAALTARGLLMVERVETGWKVLRGPGGRITAAFPIKKVAGDFRAVLPGGRSVLVESKLRKGERLTWTDFQKHQHEALIEHHTIGGLSLVAWTCDHGLVIIEYHRLLELGFRPKHGLSWEEVSSCATIPQPVVHDRDTAG